MLAKVEKSYGAVENCAIVSIIQWLAPPNCPNQPIVLVGGFGEHPKPRETADIFGVNEARPDEPLGFPGKEHFAKWPFLQDVPRLTYFSGSLDLRALRKIGETDDLPIENAIGAPASVE